MNIISTSSPALVRHLVLTRISWVLRTYMPAATAELEAATKQKIPQKFEYHIGSNTLQFAESGNPTTNPVQVVVYPTGSTSAPDITGWNTDVEDWTVAVGLITLRANIGTSAAQAQQIVGIASELLESYLPQKPHQEDPNPIFRVDRVSSPMTAAARISGDYAYTTAEVRIRVYTRTRYSVLPYSTPLLPAEGNDTRMRMYPPTVTLGGAELKQGAVNSLSAEDGSDLVFTPDPQYVFSPSYHLAVHRVPEIVLKGTTITPPTPMAGEMWILTLTDPTHSASSTYVIAWV